MYNAYTGKGGVAVTPSDTLTIAQQYQAAGKPGQVSPRLWIGGAGNLTVTTENGDVLTFYNVPAGYLLEVRALQVWSTAAAAQTAAGANSGEPSGAIGATTATNILALY